MLLDAAPGCLFLFLASRRTRRLAGVRFYGLATPKACIQQKHWISL